LKRRKVTVVNGFGTLTPDGAVAVDGQAGSGGGVIIFSGSEPRSLPGLEVDGDRIVTSDQATNSDAKKLPERVAVIGGGVIGAEFASVYPDFGVQTTLLEALPHGVLPVGPDRDTADVLAKALAKRGTDIHAEARVGAVEPTSNGVLVPFETPKGSEKIEVDQLLVAIGRRPVSEGMGLEAADVEVSDSGFISVDTSTMQTTRPGVYAIGDCVPTPGLAHVAYAEAVVAVQSVLGENPAPVDYGKVPWVVYTHPEVAWVGMTEAEARDAGHDVAVHKHSIAGNGRAMIVGDTEGLVKVVAARGGPLLGLPLVGPWASELLHEGALAGEWGALPSAVGSLIHPHPSLSEAIGETMITFSGRSLHGGYSSGGDEMSDETWVVTLPKLGESVTEGVIGSVFKQVGGEVEFDDPLFEVSTDKVDSEIPSPYDGVILEVLAQSGDTVPIGTPLVRLGEPGCTPA